jgi:hypothetical protein
MLDIKELIENPDKLNKETLPQLKELMTRGVGKPNLPDNQKYNQSTILPNPPEVKGE